MPSSNERICITRKTPTNHHSVAKKPANWMQLNMNEICAAPQFIITNLNPIMLWWTGLKSTLVRYYNEKIIVGNALTCIKRRAPQHLQTSLVDRCSSFMPISWFSTDIRLGCFVPSLARAK
ncbi:MAG: hypothetical protein ACTSRA_18865, partial [Promethearchaeota archaeon]